MISKWVAVWALASKRFAITAVEDRLCSSHAFCVCVCVWPQWVAAIAITFDLKYLLS